MSDEFDVNNTDRHETDRDGSDRPVTEDYGSDRPVTENYGSDRTGMGGVYSSNRYNRISEDNVNTTGPEHNTGGERTHESSENREYRYSYQRIPEEPKKKERKPKKEHSKVWGRIAGVIGLGIIFGLTAGVTIYLMDAFRSNSPEQKVFEEIEDTAETEKSSANQEITYNG